MNRKVALITGITGQDGSYLAELLLEKGYDVHGTIRRSSTDFRERIAHLEGRPNFHLHYADLGDSMSIVGVVSDVRPTEIYNLAAQSHVQVSFDSPEFTADVDAVGRIPQRMIVSEHADGVCDFVPNLLKGFQFQWTFLAEQWKVMFLGEPEWELLQIVLVHVVTTQRLLIVDDCGELAGRVGYWTFVD